MKSVKTLSQDDLQRLSRELWSRVAESGYHADGVIAIANGGAEVVRCMPLHDVSIVEQCQVNRPGRQVKATVRPGLDRLLKFRLVADSLRRVEDWIGRSRRPRVRQLPAIAAGDVARFAGLVRDAAIQQVLVVDDAVDSGATLDAVLTELRHQLPLGIEIRSAAITTTRRSGERLVDPDYALLDRVLCRFPWSIDAKLGP